MITKDFVLETLMSDLDTLKRRLCDATIERASDIVLLSAEIRKVVAQIADIDHD